MSPKEADYYCFYSWMKKNNRADTLPTEDHTRDANIVASPFLIVPTRSSKCVYIPQLQYVEAPGDDGLLVKTGSQYIPLAGARLISVHSGVSIPPEKLRAGDVIYQHDALASQLGMVTDIQENDSTHTAIYVDHLGHYCWLEFNDEKDWPAIIGHIPIR